MLKCNSICIRNFCVGQYTEASINTIYCFVIGYNFLNCLLACIYFFGTTASMTLRFYRATLAAMVLSAALLPGQSFAQLAINASSPTPNLSSVPRNSAVTIGFNQPLGAGAGVALRVFSSQRGGLRPGNSGTVAVVGNQLVFNPAYDFKPGETVKVSVTTAAQSAAGSLAAPRMFQFTAAATGGSGRFSGSGTPVGSSPYNVAMADVDNDGDLDMVAPDFGGASVSIRLNNGSGVFSGGSNPKA